MRLTNQVERIASNSKVKRIWHSFRKIVTIQNIFRSLALLALIMAGFFLYFSKDLPDPNKLLTREVPESTKIYAADESLLYEIHGEVKRTLVDIDKISPNLKNATVAVEDKNFYKHKGISFVGILRSIIIDILSGEKKQGGSTITQQFVKNAILTKEKSYTRKLKEIILSLEIEARFNKEDILKLYLNEIPYGRNAYGIEAAAKAYFDKHASDLTLAESAYLASIPQAPTYFNPLGPNRSALDRRKDFVLRLMFEQGYITQEQVDEASKTVVEFKPVANASLAPHFVFYVQDYLAEHYGEKSLQEGGLKVYTTLDTKLQKIAEDAVEAGVERNTKKYNAYNGALVAIDPKTGKILAMVGSRNYFAESYPKDCKGSDCQLAPNVNAATAALQPGSSFKPYVYLTAFDEKHKYGPGTPLFDVETNFGTTGNGKDYIPKNYSGSGYGLVNMRQALAGSLNISAVKTLAMVGVNSARNTAHKLGITSPLENCGLAMVLGGCEIKLVDHVAAIGVVANKGIKNEKTAILKIEDKTGKVLEEYEQHEEQVIDPQAAFLLTSIMSDNNARTYVFGPKSPLQLGDRPVAAKTGTTQNWHDGWTIGFTPSLAAGVWVGNSGGQLMAKNADAVYTAAPIWNQFMKEALKDTPIEHFEEAPGVKKVTIDKVSGKLATDLSPETTTDYFADYSIPTEYDDSHINVKYDSLTGLPATAETLPENVIYRIQTILRPEKPDEKGWLGPIIAYAKARGWLLADGSISDSSTSTPPTSGDLSIDVLSPDEGQIISALPVTLKIDARGVREIQKVEFLKDGNVIDTRTVTPYTFSFNQSVPNGTETFAFKVTDVTGRTKTTSLNLEFSIGKKLNLVTPSIFGPSSFPVELVAESTNNLNDVIFFIQGPNGTTALGSANKFNLGSNFQYQLTWGTPPLPGTYTLYAQSNSAGITSDSYTFTISGN